MMLVALETSASLTGSVSGWGSQRPAPGLRYLILTVTTGVAQSVTTLSPLIKHSSWVAVD